MHTALMVLCRWDLQYRFLPRTETAVVCRAQKLPNESFRSQCSRPCRQAPFLISFSVRAATFQNVVASDKEKSREEEWGYRRPAKITIRRDQIFWVHLLAA